MSVLVPDTVTSFESVRRAQKVAVVEPLPRSLSTRSIARPATITHSGIALRNAPAGERYPAYRAADVPSIGAGDSGGGVFAEMHGNSSIVVVEHCDEFEAGAECFEVLAKRGDANVLGMLQLGDCSLGDVESTGKFYLTDCLAMAEFVQPDLLERVTAKLHETLVRTWAGDDLVTEFGEFGSGHQISPSFRSSSR